MSIFLRAMPSALHVGGSIQDPVLGTKLETGSWIWGADVTGGAAARIASVGRSDSPAASFWIALDMGDRFGTTTAMLFRPGDLTVQDQGRRFGEVPLPSLDLSGFVGKLSASVSF